MMRLNYVLCSQNFAELLVSCFAAITGQVLSLFSKVMLGADFAKERKSSELRRMK